jgi:hypothetical protein
MRFPFRAAILAALLATSACATTIPWDGGASASLRVGMSKAEVETGFGTPDRRSSDPDGSTVWAYDRAGPGSGASSSSTEVIVRFMGERVIGYSHSTSTTTTTTTVNP